MTDPLRIQVEVANKRIPMGMDPGHQSPMSALMLSLRDGHIIGILTSGRGPTDDMDITYLTPYWWIEEQIKCKYLSSYLYNVIQ